MDNRKISICIPTWNRSEMTIESFYDVYRDERVSEIVIVDDASDLAIYEDLKSMCDALPKVKLYRNLTNQDCYRNKMTAVSYCTNKYLILLDSDNEIDVSYLDKIFEQKWSPGRIFAPVWAKPTFDYREFEGRVIDRRNVSGFMSKNLFETALNTCNYFVHKDIYLEAWDEKIDPVTSDSIYMAYRLLEKGCHIAFIEGLHYNHRVHEGSHYKNNVARTPQGFHESILQKLRELK